MNQYRIENNINWFQKYSGNSQYVKRMLKNLEYIYYQNYRDTVQVKNGADVAGTDKADDNVQSMINHYFGRSIGSKAEAKYESWCAVFVWNMVNELCGYDFNIVPDPDVTTFNSSVGTNTSIWGNAKLTAQALQERNIAADATPSVGAAFYRLPFSARTGKKSGASGHMGFVIGISDSKLYTIEGNSAILDEDTNTQHVDGIMCYEYSSSEITSLGFQFLHLENYYDTKIAQGELSECFPPETKPNEPPVKACPPPLVYNFVTGDCDQPTPDKPPVDPPTGTSTIPPPDKVTPPTTKKGCDEYFSIYLNCNPTDTNCAAMIPHWTILNKYPEVIADILDLGTGFHNISLEARNGAALGYLKASQDMTKPTGFGIFKTSREQLIYILHEDSASSLEFVKKGLLPPIPGMENAKVSTIQDNLKNYNIRDYVNLYPNMISCQNQINDENDYGKTLQGDGFYNPNNVSRQELRISKNWHEKQTAQNKDSVHAYIEQVKTNPDSGVRQQNDSLYINVPKFLSYLEQNGKTWSSPIIFFMEKRTIKTWADKYGVVFDVIKAAVSFIPGLSEFTSNMIDKGLNISEKVAAGKYETVFSAFSDIAEIANILMPETIKGLNAEYKNITGTYGKYLDQAILAANNASSMKWAEAATAMGLNDDLLNYINGYYRSVANNAITYFPDISNIKGNIDENSKKIKNYATLQFVDKISATMRTDSFLDGIIGFASEGIQAVPALQELFILNDTNSILPAFGNIDSLFGGMISTNQINKTSVISSIADKNHITAAMARVAMGYPVESKTFSQITKESLRQQAQTALFNKLPFVMPPVDPEREECYRIYIKENVSGVNLIEKCPPGYEYDPIKKTCKNNSSVGWTPETGGSIDRGGTIDLGCPPGYYSDGKGNCIKERGECPSGTVWNEKTQKCEVVTKCPEGSTWNEKTQKCEFPVECPDGYMLKDGKCVPYVRECPSGTVWNEKTQKCEMINQQIKIPKCITIIDGKYFYNVQWENQIMISPEVPVKKNETDYVTATGNTSVVTGKLTAEQSAAITGAGSVDLPTGPVKTTTPIVSLDSYLNSKKNPTEKAPTTNSTYVDLDSLFNLTPKGTTNAALPAQEVSVATIPAPKSYTTNAFVEAPQIYGYSLGDGEYWEAVVKDQGMPTERWFALKPPQPTGYKDGMVTFTEEQWIEIDKNCNLIVSYKVQKVECPDNWTKNEKGVCVPPVVKCPPGTNTKADGSCEAIVECPPGYTKNADGKCIPPAVKTPEILCPTGYYKNANGDCVPSVTPTIPTPRVPEILCPAGYYKNANGDCVPTETAKPPVITTPPVTPPVVTTPPVITTPPVVPPTVTTPPVKPPTVEPPTVKTCPDGYIKDENGDCVKKDCPPGYYKNAQGYCVPEMTTQKLPDCPDGYVRNSTTGICEPVVKDCPPGYKKDSNGNCTPSASPGDCGCNNPKETIEYKKTIYDYAPTAKRNCENDDCDD